MFSQCRHIRNCWNSVSEHAHGARGIANVSGGSYTAGGEQWRYRGPKKNPYQVEHDDLFHAIRQDLPYNEGFNGAMSTMTAVLGRMATYSGKIITMEDALNSKEDLMPTEFTWDASPKSVPGPDGAYPIPTPGVTKVL